MSTRRIDWLPLAAAAGIFGLLLFRPVYIAQLRDRMRREAPAAWEKLPTNGRFSLLVPHLSRIRYHDEAFYASCVHEILLHGRPYNPFGTGNRGVGSWIQNCISLYILAAPAVLCLGDMNMGWCLAAAVLGSAWFLLFYRVFHWWGGKQEVALPLALLSILFPDLYLWLLDINFSPRVNWGRYIEVFFQQQTAVRPNFYRLPSSFLSLFLLSCLFLWIWDLSRQTRKRPTTAVLLGVSFGLMAWVHPYEFMFGLATLAVLTGVAWLWPSTQERRWNLSLVLLAGLPIGLFSMGVVSRTVGRQEWQGYLDFLGIVRSHRPYLITLIHLVFATFGGWLLRLETDSKRRAAWQLLIAAQLGIFLCRNMQVVLGYTVQPFHFIPLGSFMGCLMLFLYASRRLADSPSWNRTAGLGLSLGIAVWALANEKAAAESTYKLMGLPRTTEAALDWAREAIPPDSLILTLSMRTTETIPLYTRAAVYVPPLAQITTPFTEDDYLRRVARLLKTCRADVDLFLAARWVLPGVRAQLQEQLAYEQTALAHVDVEKLEPTEWFHSFHREYNDDASVLEKRRLLKDLVERADPVPGPFYLWVNADDSPLLRRPPESFGGERVYQNSAVTLYRFSGDPS